MYIVRWTVAAKDDMRRLNLRAHELRRIVDAADEQLTHEPELETKHKKILRPGAELGFEHVQPVWQLSVDEFRLFYDVVKHSGTFAGKGEETSGLVNIRAVRHKPAHRTTREIL